MKTEYIAGGCITLGVIAVIALRILYLKARKEKVDDKKELVG